MSFDALPEILEAVGTATEVYGVIKGAQDTKKMADENEKIALLDAKAAREKALYDANRQREENKKLLSRQRVLLAKAGVRLDEGSPLLFLAQQTEDMEEEAHNIELMGEVTAQKSENRARLYSLQGSQAVDVGNIGAVGTILKGAIKSYGIKTKRY